MFRNIVYAISLAVVALCCALAIFGEIMTIDPVHTACGTTGLLVIAGLAATIGLLRGKQSVKE